MKLEDIGHIISDIENRFAVDEWEIQGVYIWPIIKIDLFEQLSYRILKVETKRNNIIKRLVFLFFKFLNGYVNYLISTWKDRKKNASLNCKSDVVFLNDGISYDLFQGEWYERYMDPIKEALDDKNHSWVHLVSLHKYKTPRKFKSIFVQPKLDYLNCISLVKSKLVKRENVFCKLDSYEFFEKELAALGVNGLMKDQLIGRVFKIKNLARYYYEVLKRSDAKLGIVGCYYGDYGKAFCLACTWKGIQSIDIQHGVQGKMHQAYSDWSKIPLNGYACLPSVFWVWSEAEKQNIDTWCSITRKHKVIVGSNLFLEKWKNDFDKVVLKSDKEIQKVINKDRRSILITLQPDLFDNEHLGNLWKYMKLVQNDFNWLIRLHPNMNKKEVVSFLNSVGIVNYEIDLSSKLSLYCVLRNIDVNITYSSSTLLDALEFNVPTIIVSEFGEKCFSNVIKAQDSFAAKSAEDIKRIIEKIFLKSINKQGLVPSNSKRNGLELIMEILK